MDKYIVYFITIDGDHSKEWCHANSSEEAKNYIKSEHWDIKNITFVEKLK